MTNLLDTLIAGRDLTTTQASEFFTAVLKGDVEPALLAAVLTALKIKGEKPAEIAGAALAIRQAATPFPLAPTGLTDCVGTGGDGANTINISTTAAIVAAACGIKMAKHGNRSVSSLSGSADLLEAFGVNLTMSPAQAARCIDACNLCFLFAPAYHAGFKHAAPVRAAMGVRTLFNILGPLVNPAKPEVMLLGVYSPDLMQPMAQALALTGVKRGWIVHGSGLDELAIHGESQVIEIKDGQLHAFSLTPEQFGLSRHDLSAIKGGTPSENAQMVKAILSGQAPQAHQHAVALNAAALLVLHGQSQSYQAAAEQALSVMANGQALATLETLVEVSNG